MSDSSNYVAQPMETPPGKVKLWSGPQLGAGISPETPPPTPRGKKTRKSASHSEDAESKQRSNTPGTSVTDDRDTINAPIEANIPTKKAKVKNSYDLTNEDLTEIPLPTKATEIRAELEPGDHIKIVRGRYWHHALVTSKPVLQAADTVKVNVIEFSVPGWCKWKGVRRERTMLLTNDQLTAAKICRIDGHYDFVPQDKWNKIKRHLAKKARRRIVCSCLLCDCDAADSCTCGKPERRCQNPNSHYERYSVLCKNCEHFLYSFFGTPRSTQAESACCLPCGQSSFETTDFVSSGSSSSDDGVERQETLSDQRCQNPTDDQSETLLPSPF